jgi:HEAT repeat protein
MAEKVGQVLASDQNANIRRDAARLLGHASTPEAKAVASPHLRKAVLNAAEQTFVRIAAAESLGAIEDGQAVPALVQALASRPERNFGYAVVTALRTIGSRDAVRALVRIRGSIQEDGLRGFVLKALEEIGDPSAVDDVEAAARDAAFPRSRLAALNALAKLQPAVALERLMEFLRTDPDEAIRLRCCLLLGRMKAAAALPVLWRALLDDKSTRVRAAACDALVAIDGLDAKLDQFLRSLDELNLARGQFDADAVVRALSGQATSTGDGSGEELGRALIGRAENADTRRTDAIASLLIAAYGGDVGRVADALDEHERRRGSDPEALQALRIATGGERVLDPILRKLETNLDIYFQRPISKLNDLTQTNWQSTVQSARRGFATRMVMSTIVFAVGMLLLVGSAARFLFGGLTGSELWGTGVSFVTGIGAMLLVVYSGPLKDIRQSVSDLGAQNAAFIAFVHRILQCSHTFSAYYLNQEMTFEQLAAAEKLIERALSATLGALRGVGVDHGGPKQPGRHRAAPGGAGLVETGGPLTSGLAVDGQTQP